MKMVFKVDRSQTDYSMVKRRDECHFGTIMQCVVNTSAEYHVLLTIWQRCASKGERQVERHQLAHWVAAEEI